MRSPSACAARTAGAAGILAAPSPPWGVGTLTLTCPDVGAASLRTVAAGNVGLPLLDAELWLALLPSAALLALVTFVSSFAVAERLRRLLEDTCAGLGLNEVVTYGLVPPGTGEPLLTVMQEFELDGAVIVTPTLVGMIRV